MNELLKRTQTLVNSLRAGEPSRPALGPEVTDPVLHPDRDPGRERERGVPTRVTACPWQRSAKSLKHLQKLFFFFSNKTLYASSSGRVTVEQRSPGEWKEEEEMQKEREKAAPSHGKMAH